MVGKTIGLDIAMFFDFHTHNSSVSDSGIYSLRIGKEKEIPSGVKFFTAGIHPWDLEEINIYNALNQLQKVLKTPNCLGVGEIGLDKNCGTKLVLQLDTLKSQIELSMQSNKKVLIIHCVSYYQEIIKVKRFFNEEIIWVLHGFNGSKELIQSLVAEGFYFSLGALLLQSKTKISSNIIHIPADRLFLETDDSSISIQEIYLQAAQNLNMNMEDLKIQIQKNLHYIFPSLNG